MRRAEIFENRHSVGKKFCEQIRRNDGQMINAKNFSERPYYDGEKKYKFSTANYLRLMSAEKQKIWLEFSYRDYAHGKFLISEKDFELLAEESVTDFLKNRLNKNRQEILKNPLALKKYISPNVMICTEDIFNQINLELENFRSAMKNFEQEEFRYLQSC